MTKEHTADGNSILSEFIRINGMHPQIKVVYFTTGHIDKPTDDQIHQELERLRVWFTQCEGRYGFISDVQGVSGLTASQRKILAEYRRKWTPDLARVAIALAYVVPNPAMRGVLVATSWFRSLPIPSKYFSTYDDALKWLEASLAQAEVKLTTPFHPPRR